MLCTGAAKNKVAVRRRNVVVDIVDFEVDRVSGLRMLPRSNVHTTRHLPNHSHDARPAAAVTNGHSQRMCSRRHPDAQTTHTMPKMTLMTAPSASPSARAQSRHDLAIGQKFLVHLCPLRERETSDLCQLAWSLAPRLPLIVAAPPPTTFQATRYLENPLT